MNYESDVACRVAQGNSILECWVPVRCPLGALWGWGSGVVKNFSPLKMSTFPPASISDLVSPGIVGCLGSVIWYPSSFWEKKNLQPRLSFSIPTFSNYLLSISPTRKQCPKNRCSDVGLETGLTSKMAPLGNFLHMKNVDLGLEIDPTHLKNLPHLKKNWHCHWWFESPLVARVNSTQVLLKITSRSSLLVNLKRK